MLRREWLHFKWLTVNGGLEIATRRMEAQETIAQDTVHSSRIQHVCMIGDN